MCFLGKKGACYLCLNMTGISLLEVSGVRLVSEAFHSVPCSGEAPFTWLLGGGGEEHGDKEMHDATLG